MTYYDIHTHRPSLHPEDLAIVSVDIRKPFVLNNQFYSVGVHPWYIDCFDREAIDDLFAKVCRLALHPRVKAIGETGLDKNTAKPASDFLLQRELLISHARLSEKVKKPLIIHCVKAWNDLLSIRQSIKPAIPWIIHGFRGKVALAIRLLDVGLYLSFGLHYNIDSLKIAWSKRRLLLETDDKNITICEVYQQVANDLDISEQELAKEIEELWLMVNGKVSLICNS